MRPPLARPHRPRRGCLQSPVARPPHQGQAKGIDTRFHQAPNARRQDVILWSRIGGQPPPALDHASGHWPNPAKKKGTAYGLDRNAPPNHGPVRPGLPDPEATALRRSTPPHSEVHRKRKYWLVGTKPPDATAAPSQQFWWPQCPQVSSP